MMVPRRWSALGMPLAILVAGCSSSSSSTAQTDAGSTDASTADVGAGDSTVADDMNVDWVRVWQ